MAVCCIEGCLEVVQVLVWVYLQLLVQQEKEEKEEEETEEEGEQQQEVVLQELHSPVKSVRD